MKKIVMLLPFAAAVLAAAPAQGQGIGLAPRVELKVGYDEVNAKFRLNNSALIADGREGAIGVGVEAGVDANLSENALIGVYGGYDFPRISGCGELSDADEVCIRNKGNLAAGIRGGIRLGEGGVIFAKGGYSTTRLRMSYKSAAGTQLFNGSDRTSGWHVGGGFEVPVRGSVYIKGEYVYTRYKNVLEDDLPATTNATNPNSINPNRHQIRGGIGFRFGAR